MRKIAMLMSLVASTMSGAGARTVTLCLAPHPEVNYTIQALAQDHASRIYHSISIELRWKSACPTTERDTPGTPSAPNLTTLRIEWAEKAPATIPMAARLGASVPAHGPTHYALPGPPEAGAAGTPPSCRRAGPCLGT
jgi:hypothetical protein